MSDICDQNVPYDDFDNRLNQQMRPPDGQRLDFHCLRFADVFKLEDYEKLESGLDHLYSENIKSSRHYVRQEQERYKEFLSNAKKAFISGGWANIRGFVSKAFAESHGYKLIDGCVRELPPGVSSLSFSLFHLLPSMIVVVSHVYYDDSISVQLSDLLLERCSERIEKQADSITHIPVSIVKAEKIGAFINNQQDLSETFFANYCAGEFLSGDKKDIGCKCPSIKLYSLQDIPFMPVNKLNDWLKEHAHFVQLIGDYPIPLTTYQFNNRYLLFERNRFINNDMAIDICLLTSESLFKAPKCHQMYGSVAAAIKYSDETGFDNFLSLLAINQLLLATVGVAIKHRNRLDKYNINPNSNLESRAKQYTDIYSVKVTVNDDYFDFLRFHQELEYITSIEAEQRLYREMATFELLENEYNQPDFARGMVSNMRRIASLLDKTFALINTRYFDLFESVSSLSNFTFADSANKYQTILSRLTWALIILTVAMVVIMIMQLIKEPAIVIPALFP
jgi:hypothetical protein